MLTTQERNANLIYICVGLSTAPNFLSSPERGRKTSLSIISRDEQRFPRFDRLLATDHAVQRRGQMRNRPSSESNRWLEEWPIWLLMAEEAALETIAR
jgi:hypothetical protein